uniref:Uncharacterized protein n=1 Tax=Amphimedon queenslandica TaxID=400682 RepID=A0A1X7U2X0_AMPQE
MTSVSLRIEPMMFSTSVVDTFSPFHRNVSPALSLK